MTEEELPYGSTWRLEYEALDEQVARLVARITAIPGESLVNEGGPRKGFPVDVAIRLLDELEERRALMRELTEEELARLAVASGRRKGLQRLQDKPKPAWNLEKLIADAAGTPFGAMAAEAFKEATEQFRQRVTVRRKRRSRVLRRRRRYPRRKT